MVALGAAVILDGRLQALGVTGERKAGSGVKVAPGDQFHLGSCTKAMTAVLVGMLVEERKLKWETTLAEAFPELAGEMQPAFRTVTVKELLQHRAGLLHSWPKDITSRAMWDLPGAPRQQRAAFAKMILSRPPEITPGTKYSYSNAGYSILGVIAERITDTAWEELIRRRLFEPLKMTTAGFGAMGSKGKIEQPWQHTAQNGKTNPIEPGPRSDNPPVIGPGGIAHCSLADWAKFIEVILEGARGEANPLLKPATFQILLRPEFGGDYAGGWRRTKRDWGGGEVLSHSGTNTMNYAVAWLAPKRNFAVLVVTNQGGDAAPKACDEAASAMIRKFLRRQ